MTVLFITNFVPRKRGGFEHLLAALTRELRSRGARLVLVLAGEPTGCGLELLQAADAEWHVISGWCGDDARVRPWAMVLPTLRLVRRFNPDVCTVHFGNELPALAACLMSRLLGSKARWGWQQDQQIGPPSAFAAHVSRIRALRLGVSQFVAVSEAGRASMVARHIPQHCVAVIPNSTPAPHHNREPGWLRKELGVASRFPLIGCVSSLIERKRVDLAIDALQRIRRAREGAQLVIVGDGPLLPELERQIVARGLEEVVHLLGLRDDVPAILQELDIYLHAADAEGCCYAILESMAAGIPAVVTNAGAASEQIVEGGSGYVVPCGDAAALASRALRLLQSPSQRAAFGEAARLRWEEGFRTEVAARRYADLYEALGRQ